MTTFSPRLMGIVAAMALLSCLAGCHWSRADLMQEVNVSRIRSYNRWRGEVSEDEMLPRLSGALTLNDAVKYALQYSPSLQAVVQEKEKARGQLMTAYGEALPTVEFSGDYSRLDEVATVDLGATQFEVGSRDNFSAQVSITQPLFKGGAIPAAIKGAKFLELLSDEQVREVVQNVILEVAVAYEDVLLAQHLYDVQTKALEFARANQQDVEAREEAGVAIPFDVLRAQVEVSNVEADMLRQRNLLNRARTALLRAMGASQQSEIEMADGLTYAPMDPDFERAVRKAFMNRPELFRGEMDSRLQAAALRIMQSDYLPNLEFWAWQKWAKPDPHESSNITWGRQWMYGMRLGWTLFDGFKREGNIIQQKAALRQSVIALADAEQQVLEEVKNAILDLEDADELVRSQQLNLERAGEALRLVDIGAKEGVNTELEVLDARQALTRAAGLYYQALHAHTISRIGLQRAIGMLGTPPGAREVPEEGPPVGIIPAFMPADAKERMQTAVPMDPAPGSPIEEVKAAQQEIEAAAGAPEPDLEMPPEEEPVVPDGDPAD